MFIIGRMKKGITEFNVSLSGGQSQIKSFTHFKDQGTTKFIMEYGGDLEDVEVLIMEFGSITELF